MSTLIHNRKATFNYEILNRYEAGIELTGAEVKSIRAGQGSLDGSYIIVKGTQVWLQNMYVSPYQQNNGPESDPLRPRKLLLTKAEIKALIGHEQGLTIVPLLVYNKGRHIKVEIATVRGKKKFDKRESIKKRDVERDVRREFTDRWK